MFIIINFEYKFYMNLDEIPEICLFTDIKELKVRIKCGCSTEPFIYNSVEFLNKFDRRKKEIKFCNCRNVYIGIASAC